VKFIPRLKAGVFFHKGLIKIDTSGYVAYDSPNFPPLGEAGDRIVINEKLVRPRPDPVRRRFNVRTRLDTHVTTVMIYPGIQNTELARGYLLEDDKLKGAIVLSYGSGNIPTDEKFLDIFKQARKQGLVLANVSQCRRGPVELGIYETSALLLEAGFVAANDLTLEAALCKLMALLGDPDISREEVEELYQQAIAGEQSVSLFLTPFPGATKGKLSREQTGAEPAVHYRIPARPLKGVWDPTRLDRALLRFRAARLQSTEKDAPVSFRVFINLDDPSDADPSHPGHAGVFRKWPEDRESIIIFDVTGALAPIARPDERVSFTLFVDSAPASFSWDEVELALFIRDFGE
jgi:hypothetical protein